MYTKFFTMVLLTILSLSVVAEPQTFTSGPERVSTIELYTSQGCSSCPPAEKYLNSLRQSPGLWQDFIPMAFHVDYWNYLGWRDRYSKATHSQRQRQYARLRNMATIYTPGFFVDGQEWRRRFSRGQPPFQQHKVGQLSISVENRQVAGEYVPATPSRTKLLVNVALLGMGLHTEIESGEREGSSTTHEFVVLGHEQQALQGNAFSVALPKPLVPAKEQAIAVWLSQGSDPTPIQAVGGMLHSGE